MIFPLSKKKLIITAALIHDIGKPDTFKKDKTGNVTFYGHDVIGAKIAKKILFLKSFIKKYSIRFHNHDSFGVAFYLIFNVFRMPIRVFC